jgi:hypothetical protein
MHPPGGLSSVEADSPASLREEWILDFAVRLLRRACDDDDDDDDDNDDGGRVFFLACIACVLLGEGRGSAGSAGMCWIPCGLLRCGLFACMIPFRTSRIT